MARNVALIGTGIMGAHMARRLAQAGLPTVVWNRDRAKAEKLTQYGVTIAETPSAACEKADVVIVMLSNGPVVEEVMFSADASGRVPAEVMRKGAALIDELDPGRDLPGPGKAHGRARCRL